MITRQLENNISPLLEGNKAIIIMGARQAGKSTLLRQMQGNAKMLYGRLRAFEFKWNARKSNVKCPESFKKAYPNASFYVITPENIEEFLL